MEKQKYESFRSRLHEIIYESNTAAGKAFDVSLLFLILASIFVGFDWNSFAKVCDRKKYIGIWT